MKGCPVTQTRNFVIAGHAGSGKTSLADLILYKTGKTNRLGKVREKTSFSDYRPIEQEKQYSIFATPLMATWRDHNLFFVDTPGNADFQGEMITAIGATDTVVITVNGVSGLEFGTVRAMKTARSIGCPRFIFINLLDRENSDFFTTLESIREAFGPQCIPVTLPIGKEASFSGVHTVLSDEEAPAELAESLETYKTALLDIAAESDEELMMAYLEGEELSPEEIDRGLKKAILEGNLIPVFAGSVEKDIGVDKLLDELVDMGPTPLDRPLKIDDEELVLSEDGTGIGFVFKTILDPFIGQLNLLRVYSGSFKSDTELFNVSTGKKERIGSLLVINGKEQTQVSEAHPGDIVALAKLSDTHTGNTLSTSADTKPIPMIPLPNPNATFAIYASKRGEEDKISSGLHRIREEDPLIHVERNNETKELLISGMGNQHVEIVVQRLKESFKTDVELRTPKVPYRETIQGKGDFRYRHKKQTGGRGQFAEVALRLEPCPDKEFEFANEVVGGNIPKNYIPAVEKGIINTLESGPLANCKVINVKATVYDGKHHPVDSSDLAFQLAASMAFKEAMKQANPILLEPIQKVTIVIPPEYMGDVSGDLSSRRGRVLGMKMEEGLQILEAEVPLAEMFSYSSQLRSITQGRGSFDMEFARYEPVPSNLAQQIMEQAAREREEEDA